MAELLAERRRVDRGFERLYRRHVADVYHYALAVSKQLDGRLARAERGALRAHLRACPDCATVARRQRAQRAAFKSLAAVPLPTSLASLFGGGGGAAVGTGVAAKAAAVVAATALAGGVGYEGARHTGLVHRSPAPKARHVGGRPASLLPDADVS